jgi:predicted DCC family thiol-disulfide oxidoreductase YuxK
VNRSTRHTVLFDASCRLCGRSRRGIQRLDWLRRFRFVDANDHAAALADVPGVTHDDLLKRMHLVRSDGTILTGFEAFRAMAPSLPLAWPLVPFLWVPGVRWLGERIYDRIARNRYRFGSCPDDSCRAKRSADVS